MIANISGVAESDKASRGLEFAPIASVPILPRTLALAGRPQLLMIRPMSDLSSVTLVCIDCHESPLALAAIEQSMARCAFAEVLFVTDETLSIEGIRAIHKPELKSEGAIARFIVDELADCIGTAHVLLIGWDAFIVHPKAWTDDFLRFDFIAPAATRHRGGSPEINRHPAASTGMCLVSRSLLGRFCDLPEALRGDPIGALRGDAAAGPQALQEFKLAPKVVAERFAFREDTAFGRPLGFEGLYNMWMFFQPQDLEAFIRMASPAVLGSREALSLAINLRNLGRMNEALMLLKAIAGAKSSNADPIARRLLAALADPVTTVSAGRPGSAVGRNDRCPCGSGRRFKQCHGAITAQGPAQFAVPIQATPAFTQSDALEPFLQGAEGRAAVFLQRARDAFQRGDAAAGSFYRSVLDLEPDNAEATSYLGVIAARQLQFEAAETLLKTALELAPLAAEYHTNLGMMWQTRGEHAAAAECYREAIRLAQDDAPAHNNLGLVMQELGESDAAIASFRNAIAAMPGFADAHWNLSLALMLTGNFEEGLVAHEWRFKAVQHRESWERRRHFPPWAGEPLAGKRLLVLAEQGLGDMIQYIRYAGILAQQGAIVVVESPPELTALLRKSAGIAMVVSRGGPYPPCDYQIAVMSLPLACHTRFHTIPAPVPYMSTDSARVTRWRQLLGEKSRSRIGVNWSGNAAQVRNKARSLPLSALFPLLARDDIEWISLQKGPAAAEANALPAEISLSTVIDQAVDFADTAALIGELDLVITVDTGVAHLAGALGATTLTLLDSAADFRWLRRRDDSPWYPTMRLLRQRTRGDWTPVVHEAAAEVAERFARPR